jgi:hypothetical protein
MMAKLARRSQEFVGPEEASAAQQAALKFSGALLFLRFSVGNGRLSSSAWKRFEMPEYRSGVQRPAAEFLVERR